jgi:endonuclease I
MKKTLLLGFLFSICLFLAQGQIPPGYYSSAAGKTGVALQAALHNIIKNHTSVSYNSLYTYFQNTDIKPNGTVWDMYSDIPGGTPAYSFQYNSGEECGNYSGEGDCFNREHSFPQSWFGGNSPMYSDLFHLYPTDGYVNNRRSNYPFGDVGSTSWTSTNGSKLGSCTDPGYSGTVFEPIDQYKGDFARGMLYMSTRYYTEDSGWPGSDMTTGSQLKTWAVNAMLSWNQQDPVSQKETDRNNYIYYHIQNNRNPFIDHPEYAALIWDPSAGVPSNVVENKLYVYPNPASGFCNLTIPGELQGRNLEVLIFSVTGIPVSTIRSGKEDIIKIDLSDIPRGIYFITIANPGNSGMYYGKITRL